MNELEIAVDLIVPDNTAYTVLVSLRQLGYTALERVERSQILRLQADARPEGVARLVERIKHAEVLFNPNKHRMSYALASADAASHNGAADWEALVTDRDDDTSGLVRLLQGPFGISELASLTRGVAWRLHEKRGPSPQERLDWACHELLANPYSQRFVVRPVPARIEAPNVRGIAPGEAK
jgi:phosphoribosylformylglycinamidine (FGAM) synthase PurS component